MELGRNCRFVAFIFTVDRFGGLAQLSTLGTPRFMKISPFILLVALIGCSRTQTTTQTTILASQMNQQIQGWVPRGTSVAAARQIMEQHQFVCTVGSYDSRAAMPPGSDPLWWDASSVTRDGKTMPVTNVTILTCNRADTNETYCATLGAVNGEIDGPYNLWAQRLR